MKRFVVLVCLALGMSIPASAQTCLGGASFAEHPMQLGVGPIFNTTGPGFSLEVGAGGRDGFGGANYSAQRYNDLLTTAHTIGAFAGSDYAANAARTVFACPLVSTFYQAGPDVGPVNIYGFGVAGGGYVGFIVAQSTRVRVVPTFGASLNYQRVTGSYQGNTNSQANTFGVARVGVGIVGGRIYMTPEVEIPMALAGANPQFSIRVGFAF